jgi:phenylalanyl-tRNA synthetase beta chain
LKFDIDVQDADKAPRYVGVTLSEISVGESPEWIQNRLKAIGLSPINNVVDITNYVLHELGQPLHAFDAAKVKGNKVVVKTLPSGTKFTTLDGIERELHEEDLMICNGKEEPMCIGGVFGGIETGVTEETTSIFLESAYFDPLTIRKTAKRHGLNTDASFRFERGIDPAITKYALKRAANLIVEIAGAKITSEVLDMYPTKIDDHQVFLSYERMDRLIGTEIPRETVKNILASLDIKLNSVTDGGLGLTIPSYRVDVTREADVIEEILRVYGYNNVDFSHKLHTSLSFSEFPDVKIQNIVANQLAALGFNETMANSLTKPEYVELSDQLNTEHNVPILNPLSGDLSAMRQSMLFSGLESVIYNINRKNSSLKFFEFGKTYHNYESGTVEQKHVTIFATGARSKERWNNVPKKSDFFYLKGVVQSVLERLGIQNLRASPTKTDIFSEGITWSLGKTRLVDLGCVKQSILSKFGIKQEVLFADINWENVLKVGGKMSPTVAELPKYPAVKRDFALLVDKAVTFSELYNLAFQTERKLLKEVDLFDVYEGGNMEQNKKSYAISFLIQDETKTLQDSHIDKVMWKLQSAFEQKLDAKLR